MNFFANYVHDFKNAEQVFSNILEVLDNPSKFQNCGGLAETYNKQALSQQLKKNTFWIDSTIDGVIKSLEDQQLVRDPILGFA